MQLILETWLSDLYIFVLFYQTFVALTAWTCRPVGFSYGDLYSSCVIPCAWHPTSFRLPCSASPPPAPYRITCMLRGRQHCWQLILKVCTDSKDPHGRDFRHQYQWLSVGKTVLFPVCIQWRHCSQALTLYVQWRTTHNLVCFDLFWWNEQCPVGQCGNFTHILQACFTGTGSVTWNNQWQSTTTQTNHAQNLDDMLPDSTCVHYVWTLLI